jgi:hypothetical protein
MPPNEPAHATPRPERERTGPEMAEWAQRARRGVIVIRIRTGARQGFRQNQCSPSNASGC